MCQETVKGSRGVRVEGGGSEGPFDQGRRPVSYHARDTLFGERLPTHLDDQRIRRVGEVTAGIDESSVEIENDKVDQEGRSGSFAGLVLRWRLRDLTMGPE